jgi:methyltransferase (TIGR00027 family)
MRPAEPSVTAMRVAAHRARHQLVDEPRVFEDPLALAVLGPTQEARVRAEARQDDERSSRAMRAFVAARSRHAEDRLRESVAAGVRQYVVLGAGLDTFGYRNPYPQVRVYEIDHPATQAYKRDRLGAAGVAVPPSTVLAPVDFERETLDVGLARAGFDATEPAFFAWLGVTPYLEPAAVHGTLRVVAGLASGSGVTFDYLVDRDLRAPAHRRAFDALAARVAAAGEPFRSSFRPETLASDLRTLGFSRVEDLERNALNARYFQNRADGLCIRGTGRILTAWK